MSSGARSSDARPPRRGRSRTGKTATRGVGATTRTGLSKPKVEPEPQPEVPEPVGVLDPDAPRIRIRGARTHNLRNIDLDLPRNQLVVITGPSGSGKSSLAFDTIFAEGQRRYVESLSAAARQYLSQLPKPDADLIEGLSPAVAISQDNRVRNPRSTVGTATEIHDYLRLLFARVGRVYSQRSGAVLQRHSIEDMVEAVMALPEGTKLSILAPVVADRPGDHAELLGQLLEQGFVRVAVDDVVHDLSDPSRPIALDPAMRHTIEVYVDRPKITAKVRSRVADSIETAARLTGGRVKILTLDGEVFEFSQQYTDFEHGVTYPEITPSLFSFNSPEGACPQCDGLGVRRVFDPRRIVPDPSQSLEAGAIRPTQGRGGRALAKAISAVAAHLGVDPSTPWSEIPDEAKIAFLEGTGDDAVEGIRGGRFEGVRPWLARRLAEAEKKDTGDDDEGLTPLDELTAYMGDETCRACEGQRLRTEARMVKIAGKNIHELCVMSLDDLHGFVEQLEFEGEDEEIADVVLSQVRKRLAFLREVGLGYLTLDRSTMTLSGGESQRVRLGTQVGAALVGITYILDEPSIGLHQRDNARLIAVLKRLRDLGNTVIVVEHDEDTIRAADWVVDMGPRAGVDGGYVVAQGPLEVVMAHSRSPTGRYLSKRTTIPVPEVRRRPEGGSLMIRHATGHNLRDLSVRVPLGLFTCITGVSGSGKSSLIVDTLLPEAARRLNRANSYGLPHAEITGLDKLDKVVFVDQSPIGRSARSNPATYTGVFAELRQAFADTNDAKMRGFTASRFSFNVKGGRCEACQGEGVRRIEMHFLPDLFVMCHTCDGRRYNRDTLQIELRGRNIADVLDLSVTEACDFFANRPKIRAPLEVLRDVGLGYLSLGQSAVTLSGGEAQRIKLAKELAKKATGQTLYILDEPTTGLHFVDVQQLLHVLQRLVDEKNTVVVIEHDLDVIKSADWVVDLGPEGGGGGGALVASGTPEQVARAQGSHTGEYLRRVL